MDWVSQNLFTTITGLDIALWLAAYAAWRYLTGPSWRRQARAESEGLEPVPVAVREMVYVAPGQRFAQRAAILAKIPQPAQRQPAVRRRLKKAA